MAERVNRPEDLIDYLLAIIPRTEGETAPVLPPNPEGLNLGRIKLSHLICAAAELHPQPADPLGQYQYSFLTLLAASHPTIYQGPETGSMRENHTSTVKAEEGLGQYARTSQLLTNLDNGLYSAAYNPQLPEMITDLNHFIETEQTKIRLVKLAQATAMTLRWVQAIQASRAAA